MFLELKNNHFILKQFNFVYLLVKNFQERQSTKITLCKLLLLPNSIDLSIFFNQSCINDEQF